jgi:hypothetical protein
VKDLSVADAVVIAVALGSALSSVWGYYFAVLVGLTAAIGALAASNTKIDPTVKTVFSVAIVLLLVISLEATNNLINRLNSMIDYVTSHSNDLGHIVSTMRFQYQQLWVQVIGVGLLLGWLWISEIIGLINTYVRAGKAKT